MVHANLPKDEPGIAEPGVGRAYGYLQIVRLRAEYVSKGSVQIGLFWPAQ